MRPDRRYTAAACAIRSCYSEIPLFASQLMVILDPASFLGNSIETRFFDCFLAACLYLRIPA